MNTTSAIIFPAIRARMGDWWYYSTTMTFAEVSKWIKRVEEIHEPKELKTWIQRELREERTIQIANYLNSQRQHFFNALVVGIYGGEPGWIPVEVGRSLTVKDIDLGDRQRESFGFIHLAGTEQIFPIDGQHRVEGIKRALKENEKQAEDEQVVIFVAHKTDAAGRVRTRRLFSTLNKYAKPVSQSEIIALSEDDVFAIVTRKLIDDYPGLGINFVPLLPSANIPGKEKTCLTTVVGLYELTKLVAPLAIRREKKRHEIGPAGESAIDETYAESKEFWDALKKHIPEIRAVCQSKPTEELAGKYRHSDGGHLLFRPVGMKAFARATRVLMDREQKADAAVKKLAKAPMELSDPVWENVLWRPETKTMLNKYVRLAQNIFLYIAGEKSDSKKYDVEKEFHRITGKKFPARPA
jgi:DNA sulfur modification protein DndB